MHPQSWTRKGDVCLCSSQPLIQPSIASTTQIFTFIILLHYHCSVVISIYTSKNILWGSFRLFQLGGWVIVGLESAFGLQDSFLKPISTIFKSIYYIFTKHRLLNSKNTPNNTLQCYLDSEWFYRHTPQVIQFSSPRACYYMLLYVIISLTVCFVFVNDFVTLSFHTNVSQVVSSVVVGTFFALGVYSRCANFTNLDICIKFVLLFFIFNKCIKNILWRRFCRLRVSVLVRLRLQTRS